MNKVKILIVASVAFENENLFVVATAAAFAFHTPFSFLFFFLPSVIALPVEFEANLSGVIELAAKDFDGSVLAVQVKDQNGCTYLVDDTTVGEKLLSYVGAYARISGIVRKEGPDVFIKVLDYSIGV